MSNLKKIEETFWFVGRLASEPEEELSGWLGDFCIGCDCFWIRNSYSAHIYCPLCRVKMKKYRENN